MINKNVVFLKLQKFWHEVMDRKVLKYGSEIPSNFRRQF